MQTSLFILLWMPQGWELVIIFIAILLLFGGKKIPELMKGIGKGIRGFKDGMKEIEEDIKSDDSLNDKK
ncbi:MAG: twin-arginine translocase TatA/TatE family subunit [Dysgonamonadaceae bacterium]|jgi:sec-independent protein translocase protein TatA|nr:twin-arginine translocase TatA/TatE family subunit [Dysgonamonadaceae bacterium]